MREETLPTYKFKHTASLFKTQRSAAPIVAAIKLKEQLNTVAIKRNYFRLHWLNYMDSIKRISGRNCICVSRESTVHEKRLKEGVGEKEYENAALHRDRARAFHFSRGTFRSQRLSAPLP